MSPPDVDHDSPRSSSMAAKHKRTLIVTAVFAVFCLTALPWTPAPAQTSSLYLRIILVKNQDIAKKVTDELAKGKPFADVASQYSIDPTKDRGGFLGRVALKDLNEQIGTMVRSLKVGGYAGPVQVENGMAFFQRTTPSHYTFALELMQSEKFQQALDPLNKDLALNPDRIHSLTLKAYALQRLNRAKEAEDVYRQIIRRDPKNVLANNNLGTLIDQEGNYTEAAKHFERAVELDPELDVTLHNLAWIHFARLNNPTKALEYIRKAIDLKPDTANYHAMLADIYRKLGKRAEAQKAIAKAVELDSKNEDYRKFLAQQSRPPSTGLAPPPKKTTAKVDKRKPAGKNSSSANARAIQANSGKSTQPAAPKPVRRAAVTTPARKKATTPKRRRVALSRPDEKVKPPNLKLVTRKGGDRTSRRVARMLKDNGFPVALRLREAKALQGLRIYYKAESVGAARKILDLITPRPTLHRIFWKSQFDVIVFVGN